MQKLGSGAISPRLLDAAKCTQQNVFHFIAAVPDPRKVQNIVDGQRCAKLTVALVDAVRRACGTNLLSSSVRVWNAIVVRFPRINRQQAT